MKEVIILILVLCIINTILLVCHMRRLNEYKTKEKFTNDTQSGYCNQYCIDICNGPVYEKDVFDKIRNDDCKSQCPACKLSSD